MRARRLALGLALLSITGSPSSALAQAWPIPEKAGAVSLVYQWINNTGHRLSDGVLLDDGKSHNQGLALAVDYGVTRKLSVSVGIPFVGAKFLGPNPPPVPPELQSPNDLDGEWHSGFQDFALSARYNVLSPGAFVLTPAQARGAPGPPWRRQHSGSGARARPPAARQRLPPRRRGVLFLRGGGHLRAVPRLRLRLGHPRRARRERGCHLVLQPAGPGAGGPVAL